MKPSCLFFFILLPKSINQSQLPGDSTKIKNKTTDLIVYHCLKINSTVCQQSLVTSPFNKGWVTGRLSEWLTVSALLRLQQHVVAQSTLHFQDDMVILNRRITS